MEPKVAAVAPAPDPISTARTAAPPAQPREPVVPTGPDPVDMRLVIEEDKASNSYVYKTVNRLTGEVIQQLPREQILQMREQLTYEAGDVVRTKA